MSDLLESTTHTKSAERSASPTPMAAPPSGPPLGGPPIEPSTRWPRRAKVIVAVLVVTTVLGALGTAVGFTSGEDLSGEVEQLESQLARVTDQRDQSRATVDGLEADLAQLDADLAQLDADLANETQRAEAAESDVAARERRIADLESTAATLTSERNDLDAAVAQLETRLTDLRSDLDEARALIDQLETDLLHGVVFEGHGIEVATTYPSGDPIHPLAVLGDGAGQLAPQLPPSWSATSIFETELVVHVGESVQTVIEECPYNGPNITRYRYSTSVAIYSATTGERIADSTLRGADPRACRPQEPWSLTELHGDEVTAAEIIGWLEAHVVTGG